MTDIRDGTGSGLIQFISYMGSKGLMNSNTAAAYRSATSKVLKIDGDGWESIDIRQLDPEEQVARFETLSGAEYTPGSLATYGTRFVRVVGMYLGFLESPSSFKPPAQTRRTRSKLSEKGSNTNDTHIGEKKAVEATPHAPELIEYPFPLTTGEIAYIRLPRSFSLVDVERMTSFIRSIAIDPKIAPKIGSD